MKNLLAITILIFSFYEMSFGQITCNDFPQIISSSQNICFGDSVELELFDLNQTLSYNLGDTGPAGGIIFYDKGFESDGWRYLEAAPNNQSPTSVIWGCNAFGIPTSSGIGTGEANTDSAYAYCPSAGTAIELCYNLVLGGYDDWYLPSIDEAYEMWQNLFNQGLGNLSGAYWTSTTGGWNGSDHYMYWQGMSVSGNQGDDPWDFNFKVRAIRSVSSVTFSNLTYEWSTLENTPSIIVSPQVDSTFFVTMELGGVTCYDSVTITVNQADVNVTQNGTTLTAVQAGANYQWLDCDNNYAEINGETNQSYTPAVTGNYSVEVTINGCVDTSACILVDFTGIDEIESLVSVHPNPTKDEVTLSVKADLVGTGFTITDNAGRVVLTDTFKSTEQKVNLSVFDNGVYFIRTDKESQPVKIIKQ